MSRSVESVVVGVLVVARSCFHQCPSRRPSRGRCVVVFSSLTFVTRPCAAESLDCTQAWPAWMQNAGRLSMCYTMCSFAEMCDLLPLEAAAPQGKDVSVAPTAAPARKCLICCRRFVLQGGPPLRFGSGVQGFTWCLSAEMLTEGSQIRLLMGSVLLPVCCGPSRCPELRRAN